VRYTAADRIQRIKRASGFLKAGQLWFTEIKKIRFVRNSPNGYIVVMDNNKKGFADTGRYRFYVPQLNCGECGLPASEAHHALHVLRLKIGAKVELFDGKGSFSTAEIIRTSRSDVFVIINPPQLEPCPSPGVHLAFAVPKGKRLDWLLEKTTELAATSLQPVTFSRSVAGKELTGAKLQRWESQCISAAKQSGVNHLPEIKPLISLENFLSAPVSVEQLQLFGDMDDSTPDRKSVV